MSRRLEPLPGEPVIVETLCEDYSMAELAAGMAESQKLMDAQIAPVFWIADMRAAPRSFVEPFMAMISRLAPDTPRHPNLRQIIYVLPAGPLNTFGSSLGIMPVFGTLEQALHYARTQPCP